ncbi:MAG: prolyl oligopeptidase family serine peptidase, partial [Clostridia bacterium]|nr:prolyl oligopeptidase family serine peptidase [Clostridia bacterium]
KLYNYAVPEKTLLTEHPELVFNLDREYYDYTDSETGESFTLPYRVYYPTDYEASQGKKYPVILFMHGHGECGKDNVAQLRNSGGHIEGLMARDDCIIVVPQCECDGGINKEWVASEHHFENTNRTLSEKGTLALRALMSLLDEFAKNDKVDTNKISAFGFSMGGFGVWELLMRKPDMFAAAVILSAAGAPASADKVLDIDIRAYHGKADDIVPVSGLELMDAAIKNLGGTKFKASYFETADHNTCIGEAFAQDGNFFTWLLEQTKAD